MIPGREQNLGCRCFSKLNSAEVVRTRVQATLDVTETALRSVTVEVEADLIDKARSSLAAAFRFWLLQGQQMDACALKLAVLQPTPGSEP